MKHGCTPPRKGFTLLELIVVMSIISLLVGIVAVVYTGVRKNFVKADCMARHNVFAKAVGQYAYSHDLKYPLGNVGSPAETIVTPESVDENGVVTPESTQEIEEVPDNYVYMNSFAYRDLLIYGISDESATCATIGIQDWMFGENEDEDGTTGEMSEVEGYQIGFIYWLGRGDIKDSEDNIVYESRQRGDVNYTLSSQTLATCLCYDGNSPGSDGSTPESGNGSVLPHMGSDYHEYPADVVPNPWDTETPEGLVVSHLDESVRWVPFEDLTGIMQNNYIWYNPK
jgi:prepilin-type N-terminal cleavage/methylation domain-containing protein